MLLRRAAQRLARQRRALGTHNRGWFQRYEKLGPEGFLRPGAPPVAFDWEAPEAQNRSECYLDVTVDGQKAGRLVVELLDDLLPETCENFRLLCGSDAPSGASYVGANFARRVVKGRESHAQNVEARPRAQPDAQVAPAARAAPVRTVIQRAQGREHRNCPPHARGAASAACQCQCA